MIFAPSRFIGSLSVVFTTMLAACTGGAPSTPELGSHASAVGTATTKYKYTGKEQDGTGLSYYGARYYDPQLGRFMSADSVLPNAYDPQRLNRYAYVRNNPVRLVDPDGHADSEAWVEGDREFFEAEDGIYSRSITNPHDVQFEMPLGHDIRSFEDPVATAGFAMPLGGPVIGFLEKYVAGWLRQAGPLVIGMSTRMVRGRGRAFISGGRPVISQRDDFQFMMRSGRTIQDGSANRIFFNVRYTREYPGPAADAIGQDIAKTGGNAARLLQQGGDATIVYQFGTAKTFFQLTDDPRTFGTMSRTAIEKEIGKIARKYDPKASLRIEFEVDDTNWNLTMQINKE